MTKPKKKIFIMWGRRNGLTEPITSKMFEALAKERGLELEVMISSTQSNANHLPEGCDLYLIQHETFISLDLSPRILELKEKQPKSVFYLTQTGYDASPEKRKGLFNGGEYDYIGTKEVGEILEDLGGNK